MMPVIIMVVWKLEEIIMCYAFFPEMSSRLNSYGTQKQTHNELEDLEEAYRFISQWKPSSDV